MPLLLTYGINVEEGICEHCLLKEIVRLAWVIAKVSPLETSALDSEEEEMGVGSWEDFIEEVRFELEEPNLASWSAGGRRFGWKE